MSKVEVVIFVIIKHVEDGEIYSVWTEDQYYNEDILDVQKWTKECLDCSYDVHRNEGGWEGDCELLVVDVITSVRKVVIDGVTM